MSDATTETIVQENASTNDVEMTTTTTTTTTDVAAAKTPTKSTPSKRRSKLERERAESEEIIKSMGGSVEGGRRTRSSARGAKVASPITPPAAKKSRVTTPRRGRGAKKDKQPVNDHSSDNENEKDGVDNGRTQEESNDKSSKEENDSKKDVQESTKEIIDEAETASAGTEKPEEDKSKIENNDVAIKKDESSIEKEVSDGGESSADKTNDEKIVSPTKETKIIDEKMEIDSNNDDLVVATSHNTEAQQKIDQAQTKNLTAQPTSSSPEKSDNIIDKKIEANESYATVNVAVAAGNSASSEKESTTTIATDITLNNAKINNEIQEKSDQKTTTDNKISNTTENKIINSIKTSVDNAATTKTAAATTTTTETVEKSQELSPTKKTTIDSSLQQKSPSSAIQNSDLNAINDKNNQNTENAVTLPITKAVEPQTPVILAAATPPAVVVSTVEASPEKLSTVDEKKTNAVSNDEPSIADSTPSVTAPL